MSRPDVAVLLPHLNVGGAEISMLRLAQGFEARGLRVELLSVRDQGQLNARATPGLPAHRLAKRSTLAALPGLTRYVAGRRPKVLLAGQPHLNFAAVLAKLATRRTRVALIEHAPLDQQVAFEGGWRYNALPVLVPTVYRAADEVIAVSAGVREQLARQLPGKRVALIANPVLPADLAALRAEPCPHPWLQGCRDRGGPPVVISVGRLAAEKDYPSLVEALALLRRERPEARLVILGEGPERARIERHARALGLADAVSLPGEVANVFSAVSRAHAFALPSRFEGFGNVLIEALACGTPVVSADCPVGPREILEDGRFGRLVPPGDPAAMAAALAAAVDDGSAPAGAEDCVERYSVAGSVERYLNLLAPLLQDSPQPSSPSRPARYPASAPEIQTPER